MTEGARAMSGHQRPHRGATDVWLTPPEIMAALATAGGEFELDPCAAVGQPWRTAAVQFTVEDDGLAQDWGGRYAWCNPPFGPDAGRWLTRMADNGNGVALCAARTETRWFVGQVWERAAAVLFLAGRPHFHRPDGSRGSANSGVPICLIGYGSRGAGTLERCQLPGVFVSQWRSCSWRAGLRDGA